jgi:hypothetical protein
MNKKEIEQYTGRHCRVFFSNGEIRGNVKEVDDLWTIIDFDDIKVGNYAIRNENIVRIETNVNGSGRSSGIYLSRPTKKEIERKNFRRLVL